jgi:hypothetical protein
MNSTTSTNTTTTGSADGSCFPEQHGPVISTIILGVLLGLSEVFPYIKKLQGNGLIEEVVVLVKKMLRTKKEPQSELV